MAHRFPWRPALAASLLALLAACGGGGGGSDSAAPPPAASGSDVALAAPVLSAPTPAAKRLDWQWPAVPAATRYELLLDPDGDGPLPGRVEADVAGTQAAVAAPAWALWQPDAQYRLRACNDRGCGEASPPQAARPQALRSVGLFKADAPVAASHMGTAVALSADGSLMAVGVPDSGQGMVLVYEAGAGGWRLQDTLKPDPTLVVSQAPLLQQDGTGFGAAVALSADGRTLVVGAPNSGRSGQVSIYRRGAGGWALDGLLRAVLAGVATPAGGDSFGTSVAVTADGGMVVVGSSKSPDGGQAFVSVRQETAGTGWARLSSVELPTRADDDPDVRAMSVGLAGYRVALSDDGRRLAVAAPLTQLTVTAEGLGSVSEHAGAVFIMELNPASGQTTSSRTLLEAERLESTQFGNGLALSPDGRWLAVGTAQGDWSGKVHLYALGSTSASATRVTSLTFAEANQNLGESLAFNGDGTLLAIGAPGDARMASLADARPRDAELDPSPREIGAVVVYTRQGSNWTEAAFLKPADITPQRFGAAVALSADGRALAVGSPEDISGSGGIRPALPAPASPNDGAGGSGAVHLF